MSYQFSPGYRVAVAILAILASTTASAGGLFGKGGLIRGEVGKWGDKHIDDSVTPIVKPAAKAAAAVTCGGVVLKATKTPLVAFVAAAECSKAVK